MAPNGPPDQIGKKHRPNFLNYQSNAEEILGTDPQLRGLVSFDEFRQVIVKLKQAPWDAPVNWNPIWNDHDSREFRSYVEKVHDWSPPDSLLYNAVQVVAHRNRSHFVRDYLETLDWDGHLRLSSWLTTFLGAADTAYSSSVARKFLISAVARIFKPGCKADHVMVLEGDQGIGKSSALKALLPFEECFSDSPMDLLSKDAFMRLRGVVIVEFAELESLSRADVSRIKVFTSSPVDSFRPPYGRNTINVPRQCVFAATTNELDYLKDVTGNRRFWPIRCGKANVDVAGLVASRGQLWAEAVAAFRAGETWHLGAEEEALAKIEQEDRLQADPLQNQVLQHLRYPDFITLEGLLQDITGERKPTAVRGALAKRVAKILLYTFRWERGRSPRDGKRLHGYLRPDDWAPGTFGPFSAEEPQDFGESEGDAASSESEDDLNGGADEFED